MNKGINVMHSDGAAKSPVTVMIPYDNQNIVSYNNLLLKHNDLCK